MKNVKVALICGVSGQDGAYLAQLLLGKGYTVWGTSRDVKGSSFDNLKRLGIAANIHFISMLPDNLYSVLNAVKQCNPDEIYYLAGQSSVALSFEQPAETIQSATIGILNILETCRIADSPARIYHAGSCECFGDTGGKTANETTPLNPKSPYAVAKASGFWLVNNYREAYGLFACTGILFNHESPLRSKKFVTQKITKGMALIKLEMSDCLYLGNLDAKRDWGHARDYVEAQWMMLQQDTADDFVIASGLQYSVRDFVAAVAVYLDMDITWEGGGLAEKAVDARTGKTVVAVNERYFRPTEVGALLGDSSKAQKRLGWKMKTSFAELVEEMVKEGLSLAKLEKNIS
jgi:GDPmannose 4,6-dehydratase